MGLDRPRLNDIDTRRREARLIKTGAFTLRAPGAIDLTVRRNAFGRQVNSFEASLSVAGLDGGPFCGVFIRAPWAERVGEDAEVLAVEPRTGKAVAVRQGPALATAFHPELTDDRRLHELFVSIVGQQS